MLDPSPGPAAALAATRRIRQTLAITFGPPEVGQRIKRAREEARFSQRELALRVGLSDGQSVSRYERGETEVPIGRLELIAAATGKPLVWFLGDGSPSSTMPTLATPMLIAFIAMVSQLTPTEILEHQQALRDVARSLRDAASECTALAVQVEALLARSEGTASTP